MIFRCLMFHEKHFLSFLLAFESLLHLLLLVFSWFFLSIAYKWNSRFVLFYLLINIYRGNFHCRRYRDNKDFPWNLRKLFFYLLGFCFGHVKNSLSVTHHLSNKNPLTFTIVTFSFSFSSIFQVWPGKVHHKSQIQKDFFFWKY